MAKRKFTNGASTTIDMPGNFAAGATTLTVADGSLFPAPSGGDFMVLTLENSAGAIEVIKVTARTLNDLTVSDRGYEGTSDQTWLDGDYVELRLSAEMFSNVNELFDDDVALPANATTISASWTFTAEPAFNAGISLPSGQYVSANGVDILGRTGGDVHLGGTTTTTTIKGTSFTFDDGTTATLTRADVGLLSDITGSGVQAQINLKANLAGPTTFTGVLSADTAGTGAKEVVTRDSNPNSIGTVAGVAKFRLIGTTLYISFDGTTAGP